MLDIAYSTVVFGVEGLLLNREYFLLRETLTGSGIVPEIKVLKDLWYGMEDGEMFVNIFLRISRVQPKALP